MQIAFAFLSASIIVMVDCLPKGKVDGQRMQEMETIRVDILTRLGLSEPLGSSEPLTVDEEAKVAAFIEPKSFEANYCLGNCKDDILLPAVFEFYKRLPSDHPASSIRPRCVPRSIDHYLPVLLLYEGHI